MSFSSNAIDMLAPGVTQFDGTLFAPPTLTLHGTVLGAASNGISSLAVATNGQLVIGSSGAAPVLANLLSADGTVTITNSAGGIDLSAAPSILTLGAFGSVPNADGLSLTGTHSNVLNMQPADGTHPGGIALGAQVMGSGAKTFSSAPIFSSLTGVLTANGASALSVSVLTQHDVLVGGASSAIVSVSPSTSGFVLTSNGTGSDPSFQAPVSSGFVWSSISSAPTTASNHGYMATASLTVTLPSAPADGYIVALKNASAIGSPATVLFQASGSDVIQVGSAAPSAAAGTATSTVSGNCLELMYQASGTQWINAFVQGTWAVA